jgi:hypothetical protein
MVLDVDRQWKCPEDLVIVLREEVIRKLFIQICDV